MFLLYCTALPESYYLTFALSIVVYFLLYRTCVTSQNNKKKKKAFITTFSVLCYVFCFDFVKQELICYLSEDVIVLFLPNYSFSVLKDDWVSSEVVHPGQCDVFSFITLSGPSSTRGSSSPCVMDSIMCYVSILSCLF